MKIIAPSCLLLIQYLILPTTAFSQNDACQHFNKVRLMMEAGFGAAKGVKSSETTKDYTSMIITTKKWVSTYLLPDALSADITEILRVSPDPKYAGHNIYITFNLAKNSTFAAAESVFNKQKEKIKACSPANWKVEERSGKTYARYTVMNGAYYDESPRKISLQFSKVEGPGDKYTADLVFDSAVK